MTARGTRVSIVAVAALASLTLGGCTGTTPDEPAEVITELNIPAAETPWLDSFKAIIAEYEAESGVTINLTSFPFDGLLTQEANAAQSGSNAFDLFLINEQWTGQFYDNQWLQKLTDVDPGFKWDENLIEFDGVGRWDADTRTTSLDGDPYALPINGNIHEWMYRTDLYDQLGLDVPTTWEKAIENGEAARTAGAVENGYVVRGKTPSYDFSSILYSYGGSFFADEHGGDWTPAADSDEFREALKTFKALADLGPAAPQTVAQAEAVSLMQGGTVLQGELVAATAAPLENSAASLVAGKIGYAEVPGGTPVSGTWVMGVPTGLSAARATAAMDFLTWLTSADAMQSWADQGGVTTRTDVESDRPDLKVIVDSADDIRGGFRYPFTPAFLDVTEAALSTYLAGEKSLDETVTAIQDGLTKVVKDAGYLE